MSAMSLDVRVPVENEHHSCKPERTMSNFQTADDGGAMLKMGTSRVQRSRKEGRRSCKRCEKKKSKVGEGQRGGFIYVQERAPVGTSVAEHGSRSEVNTSKVVNVQRCITRSIVYH